jgi:hypothetical protein
MESRIKYLAKGMSRKQKELYALIVELKQYRAVGPMIRSCKILMQFGLIKHCPNSKNITDFVLNGKPYDIPVTGKLPLKKDIVQVIKEKPVPPAQISHKPLSVASSWSRPPADHTNVSQEDHINKWLNVDVPAGEKEMVPVKCLNGGQMHYIMAHYENKTTQEMAEHLRVEKYAVKIFCQANGIEPYIIPKKKKPKDDYHTISPERLRRMKRADYNRPKETVL